MKIKEQVLYKIFSNKFVNSISFMFLNKIATNKYMYNFSQRMILKLVNMSYENNSLFKMLNDENVTDLQINSSNDTRTIRK